MVGWRASEEYAAPSLNEVMNIESSENLFQRNLQKLEQVHPLLFKKLQPEIEKFKNHPQGTDGEHFVWEEGRSIPKNFLYVRENPPFKSWYHKSDPQLEAREVLDSVDLKHPSATFFFGIGLGFIPKLFFKHRPATNFVACVIERNAQIFLRSLCAQDWSAELDDPTIYWIIGEPTNTTKGALARFFADNTTVDRHIRILPTPMALYTEPAYYEQVAKDLMHTRDTMVLSAGNSVEDQFMGLTNVLENISHAIWNPGICPLYDQFMGATAISVAAGPSLNEHFETLRRVQGKIPIIAPESALRPLQLNGIQPDFLTALERDDYVPRFFQNMKFDPKTLLIGPALLKKDVFDMYDKDKVIYCPSQAYVDALGMSFLGPFGTGSSVGNLNLSVLRALGFKTIIMVGHNLAYGYGSNETHVRGTIDPDRERSRTTEELAREAYGTKIPTMDGQAEVYTKLEWNYFRAQMEVQIGESPDVTYINTAPKGAFIAGTKLMSLEEALAQYGNQELDVYPKRKALTQPVSFEVAESRLLEIRKKCEEVLERVSFWNEKSRYLVKQLRKWESEITESEIKGRKVSEVFLNQCIDELLDIKVSAVNEDNIFNQFAISMILPAHMAFERSLNEIRANHTNDYDLKKDFLLRHKNYFQVWNHNLPKLEDLLKRALATHLPLAKQSQHA